MVSSANFKTPSATGEWSTVDSNAYKSNRAAAHSNSTKARPPSAPKGPNNTHLYTLWDYIQPAFH